MNYTMITNHAHARMHKPPSCPSRGIQESRNIGFFTPILKFPSAEISKTINMLCKHGTTNVIINKIKMKWYKY